jgi:hypothetical protein
MPWPSLDTASWIADLANVFFIGSLVVGVVATIAIVWMANVKEAHWDIAREQAQERIAELNRETVRLAADAEKARASIAEANASGESAKADAAKANATAAEATERNTQLEIRLEEERKNRIALQKALATPHLTPEQIDQLAQAVRGRVPLLILEYTSDASSLALAQDIKTAFERAGVQIHLNSAGIMSPKPYGLFITIPSNDFRFLPNLFEAFGLSPKVGTVANQPVRMLVGEKPPPF